MMGRTWSSRARGEKVVLAQIDFPSGLRQTLDRTDDDLTIPAQRVTMS